MEPPTPENLNLTGPTTFRDWKPGQCVIVTDATLFIIVQNMWLDNLFLRYKHTDRSDTKALIFATSKTCNLWMTNITIQGDGSEDPVWGGLSVSGGQVYAEGVASDSVNDQLVFFVLSDYSVMVLLSS